MCEIQEPNGTGLPPGLYEKLVDDSVARELEKLPMDKVQRSALDKVGFDQADAISRYLRSQIAAELDGKPIQSQLETANRVLKVLREKENGGSRLSDEALLWISGGKFDGLPAKWKRPATSVARNAVFTASRNDPQLYQELNREIRTADEVYMVVSFIMWGGVLLLQNALEDLTRRGGKLRVITTTYMGNTQLEAVERLCSLPNTEIRVDYDCKNTRLHAKAYVFQRHSGFGTAYIGSSNLSNPALSGGFEWNTKIAEADSQDVFDKILITCEEYWNDPRFELYDESQRERLKNALKEGKEAVPDTPSALPAGNCVPFPYQEEVLERLEAEREMHDRYRNLVVAATGTGKTVISAFDYRRFCEMHVGKPCRLLFVAHREEILKQSLTTFRRVLGDEHFGELHVGGAKAEKKKHLFMSIQSLNAQNLCDKLPADHFDYIVVDEFHHAAAPSYQKLLEHFRPKILLGLTATPERLDKKDILSCFGGRIAAEIRLPDAIDQDLLCPFHYFGLADTVDLDQVRWTRGGYDMQELNALYTSMDGFVARKRAAHILDNLEKYAGRMEDVKALGFCVSVAHAQFMAEQAKERGIRCAAITGDTVNDERVRAVKDLAEGKLQIIFCVDLFNEGVDIPAVNTVLFLRPTESLTVFLQQLGRGLRLCPGKDYLLVLDFIGQANRNYRFDEKFSAMSRDAHIDPKHFPEHLPRGCSIELEEKPMQIVLSNIERGFCTRPMLRQYMEEFIETQKHIPTLTEFLSEYRLKPVDVYSSCLFSELIQSADPAAPVPDVDKSMLSRFLTGMERLCRVDSPQWMEYLVHALPGLSEIRLEDLPENEQRMMAMLYFTFWQDNVPSPASGEVREALDALTEDAVMLKELLALLHCLVNENKRMIWPVDLGFPCPLEVHGNYTRDQIYAALGNMRPKGRQEGVVDMPAHDTIVLLVTLNKDHKHFTEAIAYEDYAINRDLFHWQSQNDTTPESVLGQRYIKQRQNGTNILLFVRRDSKDKYRTVPPYRFVGPVDFVRSEGSKPMSIIWKLHYPLDPEFLQKVSRLVV